MTRFFHGIRVPRARRETVLTPGTLFKFVDAFGEGVVTFVCEDGWHGGGRRAEAVKGSTIPFILIPQSREKNLQLFVFKEVNTDASLRSA